jgi:hypothetical protein
MKRTTTPRLTYDTVAPGPFLFSAVERPNQAPDLTWAFIVSGRPANAVNTVRIRVVGGEVFASLDTLPQAERRSR